MTQTAVALRELNLHEMGQSIHCGSEARLPTKSVDVESKSQSADERPLIGAYPIASFPRRLLAMALDFSFSLAAAVLILAILVLPPVNKPSPGAQWDAYLKHDTFRTFAIVALVICYIVYPIISIWIFRGTVGKRLLHLQIVDHRGRHVGILWVLVRHAVYILSAVVLPLAIAWIAFDRNTQGWHDKIAKTHVTYAGGGRIGDQRTTRRPRTTDKGRRRGNWPTD